MQHILIMIYYIKYMEQLPAEIRRVNTMQDLLIISDFVYTPSFLEELLRGILRNLGNQ